MTGAQTAPCMVAGCPGSIVDGYCDTCGMAPRAQATSPTFPMGRAAAIPRLRPSRHRGPTAAPTARSRPRPPAGRARGPPAPGAAARCAPASGRARRGAVRPDGRPGDRGHGRPRGPRGQAVLLELRRAGGPGPRRPAGPDRRASAPSAATPTPSRPSCEPGEIVARPVRGASAPGPRRPRLDLPGAGPGGVRPVGGPQGPAGHGRPGRHGGGGLRAALPGGDRAPHHRRDLQLRDPRRTSRLHRHGVRGRQVAQGDRQRSGRPPTAGADPLPVEQACAYGSRRWRPWPPARPRASCTATSSSTT